MIGYNTIRVYWRLRQLG